jgi:TetR/AcrR family fatty acid metabolism transcriptional regulator
MAYRTTPKMAERKDRRRRRLLTAAVRMFGARGYHATTVPMIVAEAGSSTGSFYFYFRNKEDIFAAVLGEVGERISSALNEAIAETSEPMLQMKAAVQRLFVFLAEHPNEARILVVESSGLSGRLEQIRRNILDSHARGVEATLSNLSPTLPPFDTSIAAHCWVGAVFEAVRHWIETPAAQRPPADAVAAEVARFNLRAINAPPRVLD